MNNPTDKQAAIIKTYSEHPDLSLSKIGKLCDTDHAYVIRTLQQYNIDYQTTRDYKEHKADILAGLQAKYLKFITDDAIKDMISRRGLVDFGILGTKEAEARGNVQGNQQVQINIIQFSQQNNEIKGNQ